MDCVVLTYDALHRKTYDTLCLLKASGYQDVLVWSVPMHYKKIFHPIYEHRPSIVNTISPDKLCRNFNYSYIISKNGYEELNLEENTKILVCGAGIIPEDLIKKYIIINSHPGYIPYVRGLDSLKWAIIEDLPIGVTTHIIGDEVDAGEVIERIEIPIYKNDTFHAVAQRLYDKEITMLVESLKKVDEGTVFYSADKYQLHKRMGPELEKNLLEKFAQRLKASGIG